MPVSCYLTALTHAAHQLAAMNADPALYAVSAATIVSAGVAVATSPYLSLPRPCLPRVRAFKVGGIRFLRLGRVQFSFCLCRK